jgi:hypothetical protein
MSSENREYPRKPVKATGLISIALEAGSGMTNIRVQAVVRDISLGGFCLGFDKLPGELNFTPARAHNLIGQGVSVKFVDNHLTVWGEIVRFDARAAEMAVQVSKTSNNAAWQAWCDAQV